MSDLRDLYQEVILDHNRNPRNFREMDETALQADGHNPLCGDNVTVFVKLVDERIEDVSFVGTGCAISKASASLMTEALKGCTHEEADGFFERFHQMVTGQLRKEGSSALGKLEALAGVSDFPVRVKCATLAWHTLKAAFEGQVDAASTE